MTRTTRLAAAGFALLAIAAAVHPGAISPAYGVEPHPPNVVFIMLDDVSTGYFDAMPYVHNQIGGKGVEFENGIVPTALCCPSRAATLSGKYAHTTNVYQNSGTYGGYHAFKATEPDALPVHLSAAGYRTALFGKYLNGYGTSPTGTVPPGWDEFQAFRHPAYYNYQLGGTVEESYGDRPVADYSTDVLAAKATAWVETVRAMPEDKPFFLYFSPYAAHAPMTAAPRHRGEWYDEPLLGAFNEKDVTDKPQFMQDIPLIPERQESNYVDQQRKQHEMLMAVDEAVFSIINAIGPEASNTLFVLMGDNGYLLGSHRLEGKNFPYVRSTRVPMMMRLDGVIDSSYASRLTTNVDLTATIAEVTGTSWPMDGQSVLSTWRNGTVLEQMESEATIPPIVRKWHPAYCGFRTAGWLYVHWTGNRGKELYRYATDPNERDNLIRVDKWNAKQQALHAAAKAECSPTPPGFNW